MRKSNNYVGKMNQEVQARINLVKNPRVKANFYNHARRMLQKEEDRKKKWFAVQA